MKVSTKISLTVAASVTALGAVAFVCVMSALDWSFTRLSTVKYESEVYEITEAFDGIAVDTDNADIVFAETSDSVCRVECFEEEKSKHSVTLENGILTVKAVNKTAWYDYIGIGFSTPKITLYLPKKEYVSVIVSGKVGNIEIPENLQLTSADITLGTGDVDFKGAVSDSLKINTTTGDIGLNGTSAASVELKVTSGEVRAADISCNGCFEVNVTTGDAYLTDIKCKALKSQGSTGNIFLDGVVAEERFSVERSTGDLKLSVCDATEIFLKTVTGNITGSLLTDKVFVTETHTGNIDIPKISKGGKCEIITYTGDIKITVR